MALNDQELKRLQKLACLRLSTQEETKLGSQLENIITFLDQLKQLDTSKSDAKIQKIENPLRTLKGAKDFDGSKKLLQNVKHEQLNNCIVIKSVLS